MGRAPCCDKANVKKGPWSPEEDAKLKSYIEQHGTGGNWITLPQKIGLKRCGKSCRLRWLNYLRPNIKHGGFSEEEDDIICSLYVAIGSRWSIIASRLPGRTDNDIKNYWNTKLRKKLLGKQRKDSQQARQLSGRNQEGREYSNCCSMLLGKEVIQNSCNFLEPAMSSFQSSQVFQCVSNDHSSMGRLTIKLGGRPSIDNGAGHQAAVDVSEWKQEQLHGNYVGSVYPSGQVSSFLEDQLLPPGNHVLQGYKEVPLDLDDMLYGNTIKLEGLDGMYGVLSNMVNGNSTASVSMSWNEASPLIHSVPLPSTLSGNPEEMPF